MALTNVQRAMLLQVASGPVDSHEFHVSHPKDQESIGKLFSENFLDKDGRRIFLTLKGWLASNSDLWQSRLSSLRAIFPPLRRWYVECESAEWDSRLLVEKVSLDHSEVYWALRVLFGAGICVTTGFGGDLEKGLRFRLTMTILNFDSFDELLAKLQAMKLQSGMD